MPVAVPLIAAIAADVVTAGAIIGGFTQALLINLVLSKITSSLTSKPASSGPPPVNVSIRATVEYRRIVLGTARCGGVFLFYRTSGSNNEILWYVIAYAGHQCSAIGDAYLDTRYVPTADINRTTGAVATSGFNGKLHIWDHLGTGSQTAAAELTAGLPATWLSTHYLKGTCYRVIKMERDDTAWPSGAPGSISSIVDGALLYDPRLDSTNGGSGSHRASDPSTWAFSGGIGSNPALQVRWFLSGGSVVNDQSSRIIMYGLRESDSRIEDSFFRAAANVCDQSLSGANAPPSGAQTRYTCGIELTCGQIRREITTELLATMGPGTLAYVHGKWRLYAAAYNAPVHAFTQDDLYGEMSVEDTSSAADRFNAVSATYTDASQGYVPAPSPFRTNSTFETQDGGQQIQKTIALRGVTNVYQAQRICELTNRTARFMRNVVLPFGRQGMKVANAENFTLSHARYTWVAREFSCQSRQLQYGQDGGVTLQITAKQDDASIYTDLLTADYTTGTSVSATLQTEAPEAPTGLTATSLGGQNIRFDWVLGSFWLQNGIVELWEGAHSSSFGSATLIWSGRGTTAIITKGDTITRDYWVRIRTIGGVLGATDPASSGVAAAAGFLSADTVQSTPADSSFHYGTVSTTPALNDTRDVATVSYTNPDGVNAANVTVSYKGLFSVASTEASGCNHYAWLNVSGSATYAEGPLNNSFRLAITPDTLSRSGSVVVSVPAGGTITAALEITMHANAGTSIAVPDALWKDVALYVHGVLRQ